MRKLYVSLCSTKFDFRIQMVDNVERLNAIMSTKLVSRRLVLKDSKAIAAKESTSTNTVAPDITSNIDAQEEADRINMFRLATIGAKEGAAAGINKVVGTDITDDTLRTTDIGFR